MGRDVQRFAFACASTSAWPCPSSTEYPTPQRAPRGSAAPASEGFWGLLTVFGARPGLCTLRLLLDRLGGFWRLSEGLQLSAQLFKLSLCFFPSAAFLGQLLLQSGLC